MSGDYFSGGREGEGLPSWWERSAAADRELTAVLDIPLPRSSPENRPYGPVGP